MPKIDFSASFCYNIDVNKEGKNKIMIYCKTKQGLIPKIENNSIYISRKLKTPEEFSEAIGKTICMLISEGYQCEVHNKDFGATITYNPYPNAKDDFGDDRLMWVTCEEEEAIISERYRIADAEDANAENGDERKDD